jgi:hypothetical protein
MTLELTHYQLTPTGVRIFIAGGIALELSAQDALHLMNLLLRDQLKLNLMVSNARANHVRAMAKETKSLLREVFHGEIS